MFMLLIEPLHFALKLHQIDAFNLKKNVQHLPPPPGGQRSAHQNLQDSLVKNNVC